MANDNKPTAPQQPQTKPADPPKAKPEARGKVLGKVRYAALTQINHGYVNEKGENVPVTFQPGDEVPAEIAESIKYGEERGIFVSSKKKGAFAVALRPDDADEDEPDDEDDA